MTTQTRPAREAAIARMNDEQDNRVAQIAEQRARPSALANMAARLNISEQKLMATLQATVFKGASQDEFAALVVVADAYKLNPLLKEIYAFPVKGGGIAPMVSIDGWIRIINDHPEFDGIEFKDMADDKGKLYAIEATIFRKDRQRPTQIIEYLEECKRNTDPWNKSPARMLRHRALMQCARYAFGFSGIGIEEDADLYQPGPLTPTMRDVTPPARGSGSAISTNEGAVALAAREVVDADGVVSGAASDSSPADEAAKPEAAVDDDNGASEPGNVMRGIADSLIERIGRAETVIAVRNLRGTAPPDMPEELDAEIKQAADDREAVLRAPK